MRRMLSLILVLVLVLVLPLVTVVSAKTSDDVEIVSCALKVPESVGDASPYFLHRYEKTVINYYSNFDDVPSSIEYSEYSDEFRAWFSGTLYVKSVTRVANMRYEAVYSG